MDKNLDNDAKTIQNAREALDKLFIHLKGVNVMEVKDYIDTTLFILSSPSIEHENEIRTLVKDKVRLSIEYTQVEVNLSDNTHANGDDTDPMSNYIGRFPVKRQTLAIRRKAFKKLVIYGFVKQAILSIVLGFIMYTLYCVLL